MKITNTEIWLKRIRNRSNAPATYTILSPGFGDFPSANCIILFEVGRNCDTPVYGLLAVLPCNIIS